MSHIDIVFSEMPGGDNNAVFVEVENWNGESIRIGELVDRNDGTAALRLTYGDIIEFLSPGPQNPPTP